MRLSDLPNRKKAYVTHVVGEGKTDPLRQRLQDIGFVAGEPVAVVARAPWSGDPVLVQVGGSRFALRRNEASMILVEVSV